MVLGTTVAEGLEYLPEYISVVCCCPTNHPQNLVAYNNDFLFPMTLCGDWAQLDSSSATFEVTRDISWKLGWAWNNINDFSLHVTPPAG